MHITDPQLMQDLRGFMDRSIQIGYRNALKDMKKRRARRDLVFFACGSIAAFIGVIIQ